MFETIFGISKSLLFPNHWETSLITSKTKTKNLITGRPLDYALSLLNAPIEHEDLLIIKDKTYCQRNAYMSNGLCLKENIKHLIQQEGCALYLRWLEKYDVNFNSLVNHLNLEMSPFKFNFCLFYSPASGVLFEEHFDAHDAFIIQLEGSKKWQIWPAIVSEVEATSTPHFYSSTVKEHVAENAPSHEITLEAGDVMYLPRCTIHRALPTGDNSSHLNVWMIPRQLKKFIWEM
ncbi:JmjC domain-containing protein [Pseudomonas sp. LH1G9]|uniref:JmjC domain-containing protein n=1 Tax=Pseudomonas sp. LH1G9 TaxID=2083055 RepID=UPI000CF35B86|nr:cupin domain-containing protein [Pseudomonas sp. LH1G9]